MRRTRSSLRSDNKLFLNLSGNIFIQKWTKMIIIGSLIAWRWNEAWDHATCWLISEENFDGASEVTVAMKHDDVRDIFRII